MIKPCQKRTQLCILPASPLQRLHAAEQAQICCLALSPCVTAGLHHTER